MRPGLFLSILLALAPAARASGAGADPFNFLFLDADARPVAMGGAYTALAGDANSLLYNPAGLARVRGHEATFMHNQHFVDITQEYAAYASRWGWGANINTLRFGDTARTTYSNPGGSGLGSVGMDSMALGLGYGRELFAGLRAGAGLKYIHESIAGVSASGYAADLGVQHDPAFLPGLSLGAAVQNLGPSVRFQHDSEKLPMNLRIGTAYAFGLLGLSHTAAFDATKERSESPLYAFGFETLAAGSLPVRFGFNTRNQAGPGVTAGIGWRTENLRLDYAFVPYGALGSAHRFSVTVRWGKTEDVARRAESLAREDFRSQDSPNARFSSADRFLAAGQASSARRELDIAKGMLSPGDRRQVLYYQKSGEAAMLDGDADEARELFIQALREARRLETTGPAVAASYIGLGRCYEELGRMDAARQSYEKALEVDPAASQASQVRAALEALGKARPKKR